MSGIATLLRKPNIAHSVPAKRLQFTLRTLLITMLCATFFFGGIQFDRERQRRAAEAAAEIAAEEAAALALQRRLNRPTSRFGMIRHQVRGEVYSEVIRLRDGSEWSRTWRRISPDDGARGARPFHSDE